ncbi:glycosyltransferase family 2 protein [Chryseobacterium taiwanense]|uniref:Glycosyltransferase 2-like domain-containing protein n=1 Tax=Chryseobacterium taiwanense TaxID=363331 RepID=A0A0B4CQA6_9FLAO|nr:glycosyltransferase [Chryseobacterium taiwanense]KIC63424.1 hypothetical protein RM51_07035 [Chryseobacterium taiwanense]
MNNSTPFFSIVIPTYNHAELIGRCIESLLCQSYQNWEAIVVNNFSEDNTIEVVERYNDPRIRLINNANGGVIAVSRNKGLSVAKGNWICFLDSDDWWYPNKLEVCLPYLNDYDLVHHNLDIYTSLGKSNKIAKGRDLEGNFYKNLLIKGNGVLNSSVIIKKEIVDWIGKISEDKMLIAVEDYDYWIRAAKVTDRFKYIKQSLGGYWMGANTSYSLKQIERSKSLLNKYLVDLSIEEQRVATALYNFNAARMYHHFSFFSDAKKHYLLSLNTSFVRSKFKAIVGYLLCFFSIKY